MRYARLFATYAGVGLCGLMFAAEPEHAKRSALTAAPAPASSHGQTQAHGQAQGQQYRSFSVEGQTNVTNGPAIQTYAPAPVRRQPMQNNQFRADRKIRGL